MHSASWLLYKNRTRVESLSRRDESRRVALSGSLIPADFHNLFAFNLIWMTSLSESDCSQSESDRNCMARRCLSTGALRSRSPTPNSLFPSCEEVACLHSL